MKIDLVKYKSQDIFTSDDFTRIMDEYKPYIIDVRSKKEFCSGHICGAHYIETPLPPLYEKDLMKLKNALKKICVEGNESPIIVYCKLGKRAGLAKSILQDLGYKNVKSLGGVDTEPLRSIIQGKYPEIPVCYCESNNDKS